MEVEGARASTKKGNFTNIEYDDVPLRGINKDKPDGRKMEKEQVKRSAEASTLRDQIASMMKSKEAMMAKHLEVKLALAKKKNQGKEKKWATRCTFEESKVSNEEEKMKADKRA